MNRISTIAGFTTILILGFRGFCLTFGFPLVGDIALWIMLAAWMIIMAIEQAMIRVEKCIIYLMKFNVGDPND